jgi:hypothetical protein
MQFHSLIEVDNVCLVYHRSVDAWVAALRSLVATRHKHWCLSHVPPGLANMWHQILLLCSHGPGLSTVCWLSLNVLQALPVCMHNQNTWPGSMIV